MASLAIWFWQQEVHTPEVDTVDVRVNKAADTAGSPEEIVSQTLQTIIKEVEDTFVSEQVQEGSDVLAVPLVMMLGNQVCVSTIGSLDSHVMTHS